MASINCTILMGRLTRDPQMMGNSLHFTIAVERNYQKPGEERQADFIGCVAFNKTAEFIKQYFTKGMMMIVEGKIRTSTWEKDGEKRYSQNVIAERISFGETKKAREGASGSGTVVIAADEGFGDISGFSIEPAEDDLPF